MGGGRGVDRSAIAVWGMGWDGDGMGWDGMGWDGREWNGTLMYRAKRMGVGFTGGLA